MGWILAALVAAGLGAVAIWARRALGGADEDLSDTTEDRARRLRRALTVGIFRSSGK